MTRIAKVLSAVCLASSLASAEVYPPDGAHLLGSEALVPLHWKLPGANFSLSVTGAGRPIAEETLGQSFHFLPVRDGTLYRWSVVPLGASTLSGGFQSFQYHGGALRFLGNPGRGLVGRESYQAIDGRPGQPGGNAPDLTISLQDTPMGVQLRVENRDYLIIESSQPILIQALGGQGATGEAGKAGAAGASFSLAWGAENGGPGGDGGSGGQGGRGGNVVVRAGGVDVSRWLKFDLRGGPGGLGGPGGPGGLAGTLRLRQGGLVEGRPGPAGRSGPPGPPGPDGTVQILR